MITARLLNDVYEAAALPELWPRALDTLGQSFGARGSLLFGGLAPDFEWIGGGQAADAMADFVAKGWMEHNDRVERIISKRHMGFLADFHTPEEMARLPIYTEWLTPNGFDAPVGTYAPGIMGTDFVLSVEGFRGHEAARAAIPVLDELRPHLARAAAISAHLGLVKAKATVAVLASLGAPAAVVGRGRRLIAANDLFAEELGTRVLDRRDGINLVERGANQRFRETLDQIDRGQTAGCSLALRSTDDLVPSVLHVLPLPGQARDIFSGSMALLAIASGRSQMSLGDGVLEALFDLTPAEARLARDLAEGETLKAASRERGVSPETNRVHLKRIFQKVGVGRQTELVTLLRDLAKPVQGAAG